VSRLTKKIYDIDTREQPKSIYIEGLVDLYAY